MLVLNLPFKALMFLTMMRPSLVSFLVLWLKLVKDFLKVRIRLALMPYLLSWLVWLDLVAMRESLEGDAAGARVKLRADSAMITDGPFAETKAVIGGFFLLPCETPEQAIDIARECPAAEWATIEVRELGPCFA